MGGTGSVVQHGQGGCNRVDERRLLKLYNRNRRDDRLSDKLLTDDVHAKVCLCVCVFSSYYGDRVPPLSW